MYVYQLGGFLVLNWWFRKWKRNNRSNCFCVRFLCATTAKLFFHLIVIVALYSMMDLRCLCFVCVCFFFSACTSSNQIQYTFTSLLLFAQYSVFCVSMCFFSSNLMFQTKPTGFQIGFCNTPINDSIGG